MAPARVLDWKDNSVNLTIYANLHCAESPNTATEPPASTPVKAVPAAEENLPLREEFVQNAVKFLSHPKVQGSPVQYRRSFLEKKGLNSAEITEAFKRVPVRKGGEALPF